MSARYKVIISLSFAIFVTILYTTSIVALNLQRTTSPWVEDGTNLFMAVQRNICIGTGPTAVDALSLCTSPVASATRALLNLSNTALSAGSASGTYLGANPLSCTGNFLDLQLADAARAKLTCAGALTVISSTNNLSIFAATTSAQLAGVLSDETGTGLAVFSIAPVFTSINNNLSIFAATTSAQLAGVLSDETGTGAVMFAGAPLVSTTAMGITPAANTLYKENSIKAWGVFDGRLATFTVFSCMNCGVVRNSAGNYTVTMTTGMVNTNSYAVSAIANNDTAQLDLSTYSSTQFIIITASGADVARVMFIVAGQQT